jgi:hypothetical protein
MTTASIPALLTPRAEELEAAIDAASFAAMPASTITDLRKVHVGFCEWGRVLELLLVGRPGSARSRRCGGELHLLGSPQYEAVVRVVLFNEVVFIEDCRTARLGHWLVDLGYFFWNSPGSPAW